MIARLPLVSVAVPAFNAAQTVMTAIKSVLAQSVTDFELVVCDDASTDGTVALVSAVADRRIRVVRNNKNVGIGGTRDRAIATARAPWVAVLDADDAWEPKRLERLLAVAGEPSNVMVLDDVMTCHDVNGKLVPWRPVHGRHGFGCRGRAYVDFALDSYVASPRMLIKPLIPTCVIRETGSFHSNRRFGEDAEFFIRLAATGTRFRYVPDPLYLYRVNAMSATSRNKDRGAMHRMIADCYHEREWTSGIAAAFEKKIAMLRADETLYESAKSFGGGHLAAAALGLLSDPRALTVLPRRAWQHFGYEVSRILNGGAKR